ncbi:inositol monophosphatase [Oleispirillum naphthae]|uniref:inositol monophosphatase family protein n=1 Tax=Oleispirillum naphthae TaxID=2838853 RepID=UPI0030823B66
MAIDLDFDAVGDLLREAADTLVCPRFRHLDADAIGTKSHEGDLVTVADLETEVFLTRRLTELLPGSLAMGEEAVYQDPANRACLHGDAPVWIIDPVDGTANFARGNPAFGIIVALVRHRKTLAGWIYDPMTRRLFTAERGGGAWCGGERLSVRARGGRRLAGLDGCLGRRSAERLGHLFGSVTQSGSAAHDYMALSQGKLDFRLFRLLMPWDHAAGVLMVQEAGGCVRLLSGETYAPLFLNADGLLIAPDAETWDDLKTILA